MRKIFNCIMIIIGTIIGAGYASGKEIALFFNCFKTEGIFGILVSSILFGAIIVAVMVVSDKNDISDYKSYVKENKIALLMMKIFSFICFSIMLAGIGIFIKEQFHVSYAVAVLFPGIVCFISFMFKFQGLEKIHSIFVPAILLGIILLEIFSSTNVLAEIVADEYMEQTITMKNWFQSSILYVGYNSILLVPILLELKRYQLKKGSIVILGIMVSLVLSIVGLMIFFVLERYYPAIMHVEMPMMSITKLLNPYIMWYYSIIIIFAIFTTAFSSGYTFLRLTPEKYYFKNCFKMCVGGAILACIGFSKLVDVFFPLFGYIGVFQLLLIMKSFIIKSRR